MDTDRQSLTVCVYGLWHLGSVTAACVAAAGCRTLALDNDASVVEALARGVPPIFEPGLPELIRDGVDAGRLSFISDPACISSCDIVWVTFDTPVDDDDTADVEFVRDRIRRLFPLLSPQIGLVISSQLPVGSTRALLKEYTSRGGSGAFAYAPENLRLGRAIEVFQSQARVVAGTSDDSIRPLLTRLFDALGQEPLWMSLESAEMVKHARNAYLATSVVFANELAAVAARVGAEPAEVEQGLRADGRIGPGAYIRPGPAFAGGTLARDVRFLIDQATRLGVPTPQLNAVMPSNAEHRRWAIRELRHRLGDFSGTRAVVLGLAYKAGTNATRRSTGVEICRELIVGGAAVTAVDPRVDSLPEDLMGMAFTRNAAEACRGAAVVVVATEWPEFRALDADGLDGAGRKPLVIDQSGWLAATLGKDPRVDYVRFGALS